jgi:Resolvase, N terminal domain
MRPAVLYARVSSKDQEREGFSIPAQLKFLREYAQTHEFNVLREFVDVETAKTTGRKQFGEMVRFLRDHKLCRVVLVEKTDRLYRNFRDCVTLEDLDVEIHLLKKARSSARTRSHRPSSFMAFSLSSPETTSKTCAMKYARACAKKRRKAFILAGRR